MLTDGIKIRLEASGERGWDLFCNPWVISKRRKEGQDITVSNMKLTELR